LNPYRKQKSILRKETSKYVIREVGRGEKGIFKGEHLRTGRQLANPIDPAAENKKRMKVSKGVVFQQQFDKIFKNLHSKSPAMAEHCRKNTRKKQCGDNVQESQPRSS